MKRGRYYLGRVLKLGELDKDRLLQAIRESEPASVGQFQWTFIDLVDHTSQKNGYIFGKLAKYSREGSVKIVDTEKHSEEEQTAENLLLASAPFVYFPEFSGIAYLHVWNGIEEAVFRRRFQTLIERKYDYFFVGCEIDPIADYQAFVVKLKALERVSEIQAKVHPPNPLFGDLWRDLKKYIDSRNASEVQIAEKSEGNEGLNTEVVKLVEAIVDKRLEKTDRPASLTDAALLMAADGYGKGKVVGLSKSESVIIRTSDTQKSFLFNKEPEAEALAAEAKKNLASVSDERNMDH